MDVGKIDAIVLAGGLGRRFREKGGGDKLFFNVDGKPAIVRVVENLERSFSRVIVTTKQNRLKELQALIGTKESVMIVADQMEEYTPVAGMIAGAREARSDLVFITSVDSPFIEGDLPAALIELSGNCCEAVIPIWPNGRIEPLLSIYSRRSLLDAEKAIGLKPVRATDPARLSTSIAMIPIGMLLESGVRLRELANINEPSDLERPSTIPLPYDEYGLTRIHYGNKHHYMEGIRSLENGDLASASLSFSEEAVFLFKHRPSALSLHALLDSLFFLRLLSKS
ncbi:MAG: molybdenum cofactor guanylyltransferase [Fervidicoccaceae archaeon]